MTSIGRIFSNVFLSDSHSHSVDSPDWNVDVPGSTTPAHLAGAPARH